VCSCLKPAMFQGQLDNSRTELAAAPPIVLILPHGLLPEASASRVPVEAVQFCELIIQSFRPRQANALSLQLDDRGPYQRCSFPVTGSTFVGASDHRSIAGLLRPAGDSRCPSVARTNKRAGSSMLGSALLRSRDNPPKEATELRQDPFPLLVLAPRKPKAIKAKTITKQITKPQSGQRQKILRPKVLSDRLLEDGVAKSGLGG